MDMISHIKRIHETTQHAGRTRKAVGDAAIEQATPTWSGYGVYERLYGIVNGIDSPPRCGTCSGVVALINFRDGFRRFCSTACSNNSPSTKAKYRDTMRAKFGCDSPMHNPDISRRRAETAKARWGVEHTLTHPEVRAAQRRTLEDRYGVSNPFQTGPIRQRIIERARSRTGNSELVNLSQQHIDPLSFERMHSAEWLREQHLDRKRPLVDIARELGVTVTPISRIMRDAGIDIRQYTTRSWYEQDLATAITDLTAEPVLFNTRSIVYPQELDVYIPSRSLAIEFNGLYWHSDLAGKNSTYHINKTKRCAAKGVALIHIFEDEWVEKRDIVLSRLAYALRSPLITKLDSRKLSLVTLTKDAYAPFFNATHIQGSVAGSVCLGLVDATGEIVSAALFGKARYGSSYEWELLRFSTKLYHANRGAFSRLMSAFVKQHNPETIVSYADLRWSTGNGYASFPGFVFSHNSAPGFHYFRNGTLSRVNRQVFQKHKLERVLESYDENCTAWENMQRNGYNRIWDCGNSVWVWTKP